MIMRHGVLWLALTLASALPAAASVSITGRVLNHQTHRAIPDTVVFLDKLDADLPAQPLAQSPCLVNGSFNLRAPGAGRYRLKVKQHEAVLFQELVTVPKAVSFAADLEVGAPPAADPPPAAPASGVAPQPIHLNLSTGLGRGLWPGPVDAWAELLWPVQADPCGSGGTLTVQGDGSLLIPLPTIPAGFDLHSALVVLSVRRPGLGSGWTRLKGWPALPVPLFLSPPINLQGVIQDRADGPVPHATVIATRMVRVDCLLRRADHFAPTTVTADAAGHFTIPNLNAGTYDVRALVPGEVACRKLFVLSALGPECILNARENPAWTALAPQDTVQD